MAASMADSAIEKYITGFEDSAHKEICQQLIKKEVSLGEIAEHLGVYLTNTDTAVRSRGTRLLAEILNNLPTDFLSQKEGSFLTVYLCERLQDHHSLQPHALYGLLALSSSSNLPDECVEKICRTMFKEVHCQSLPQGDRRTIYTILSTFLSTKLIELQKLGTDFVYGFIQAMDGEKDPRNLVITFQSARIVIENFPLGVFTEEMFEVISCYFPIDFTPSETDPSGITKEDLIQELRYCLASTPKFAQYCLPLLLEKLTSDLKSAKIDSLQTLAVCSEVYGSSSLQEYQSSIFNCIKKEVFLSGDPAVEEAGLTALTALVKTFSTGLVEVGTKGGLEEFIGEILNEVKQHLLQPEMMLMLSTGRLLMAVARGSNMACCQILNTAVPMLTETHSRTKEATPRYNVLQVLTQLLDTATIFSSSSICLNTLLPFKTSLMEIFKSATREDTPVIQQQAVDGLRALFSIPNLLSESDMLCIGKILILKLCGKDLNKDVRKKCNDLFRYVSRAQVGVVLQCLMYAVFPLVGAQSKSGCADSVDCNTADVEMMSVEQINISTVQDKNREIPNADGDSGGMIADASDLQKEEFSLVTREEKSKLLLKNIDILETLSAVCARIDIVKIVTKYLGEYLCVSKEISLEIHQSIFQCFYSISDNCDSESLQYLYDKVVPAMYHWIITHCHVIGWRDIVRDETVLQHVAAFLRKTITKLSRQDESIFPVVFTKYCVSVYLDRDLSHLQDFGGLLPSNSVPNNEFSPLQCEEDAMYVCLLTPILCSAPVKVEIDRGKEFLEKLSALAESLTNEAAHRHVVKCLAGLVNKWKNEAEINSILGHIKTYAETTLQSSCDRMRKSLAVRYWAWITKALVLRNHKQAAYFTDKLVGLLSDMSTGSEAAAGIATVLTPCDDIMTKEMFANIRIMYRQRFFMENLPKIAKGFESSSQETKKNYLTAASHLIKDMEKQILMPELQKVFPLLIHSLQCEDVDLQLSTMLTLCELIENAPELVQKQMDSLVPKLLKLTTYRPAMKVRIAALKCIEEMTTLPFPIIIPYRGQITRALEPALDDTKRLVRKQAVSARQEWYLLDTKSK